MPNSERAGALVRGYTFSSDRTVGDAPVAGRYAVERQMRSGQPPHERNYRVVWAIRDRRARAFLPAAFRSRAEAERHVAPLRAGTGG